MSMPTFPEKGTDITKEQAFNMLLGSIAMEELALSHIMNAEGEKLQYFLGTLPNSKHTCATPREILEVNRSISDLLENVMHNQLLLKGKLAQVVEAKRSWDDHCKPECQCENECHEHSEHNEHNSCCHNSKKIFHGKKDACWLRGYDLLWCDPRCDTKHKDDCEPDDISIRSKGKYLMEYDFQIMTPKADFVTIGVNAIVNDERHEILICRGYAHVSGDTIRIAGSAMLDFECNFFQCPMPIKFSLYEPENVCVKLATICLTKHATH